jgi:hypothetical protein
VGRGAWARFGGTAEIGQNLFKSGIWGDLGKFEGNWGNPVMVEAHEGAGVELTGLLQDSRYTWQMNSGMTVFDEREVERQVNSMAVSKRRFTVDSFKEAPKV